MSFIELCGISWFFCCLKLPTFKEQCYDEVKFNSLYFLCYYQETNFTESHESHCFLLQWKKTYFCSVSWAYFFGNKVEIILFWFMPSCYFVFIQLTIYITFQKYDYKFNLRIKIIAFLLKNDKPKRCMYEQKYLIIKL